MKTDDLILLDLPDTIETERLSMRIPRPGDGVPVTEALDVSLDAVAPYLDWAAGGQSVEDSERYLRKMAAHFILRTDFIFLMFERAGGAFVGSCGLHVRNADLPEYEIGYWMATASTGKGYMTEAVNALTTYAFDHLGAERMLIRCDVTNTASANVALRAGYIEEGTMRGKERRPDGGLRDMRFFSKLRGE